MICFVEGFKKWNMFNTCVKVVIYLAVISVRPVLDGGILTCKHRQVFVDST